MIKINKNNIFDIINKEEWKTYVKKPITIRAKKFKKSGVIETLEGKLMFKEEHYICIGIAGEVYPYDYKSFDEKYEKVNMLISDVDDNIKDFEFFTDKKEVKKKEYIINNWNVYKTKYMPVEVIQIKDKFTLDSIWGIQKGKVGDYLICQNSKLFYICDKSVFETTYDLI